MPERVPFMQMFGALKLPHELNYLLRDAEISHMEVDRAAAALTMKLHTEEELPTEAKNTLSAALAAAFSLKDVAIENIFREKSAAQAET